MKDIDYIDHVIKNTLEKSEIKYGCIQFDKTEDESMVHWDDWVNGKSFKIKLDEQLYNILSTGFEKDGKNLSEYLEKPHKFAKDGSATKLSHQVVRYLSPGNTVRLIRKDEDAMLIKLIINTPTERVINKVDKNIENHEIILANIVWNPEHWRKPLVNKKAGHRYARINVPNESLNFNFDKKNIDTKNEIYGYFQRTKDPIKFSKNGLIIFYTKNTETNKGEIVGVYGKSQIIKLKEFPMSNFNSNVTADKNYSMLFPMPLDEKKYKEGNKRLVGQIGFAYKSTEFAKKVLLDEISELSKNGIPKEEYEKLIRIYEYYIGEKYLDTDDVEQTELVEIFKNQTKTNEELKNELLNSPSQEQEYIDIKGKKYKRNNVSLAKIKIIRGIKCQICKESILKKDGSKYVESAHITPKAEGGSETLDNILVLCPNHHKEFDLGDTEILYRDKNLIKFTLNQIKYSINL
ncbi:MAG: HNH endonuclease [Elusimicrobiota bacterium]|nr:HNH endonuclease [Elusimicrobiota bacterium]